MLSPCIVLMTSDFYVYIASMAKISIAHINYYHHSSISNILPKMFTIYKTTLTNFFTAWKTYSKSPNNRLKHSETLWKAIFQNFNLNTLKESCYFNKCMKRKKIILWKLVSRWSISHMIFILNFKKLSLIYGNAKPGTILIKE